MAPRRSCRSSCRPRARQARSALPAALVLRPPALALLTGPSCFSVDEYIAIAKEKHGYNMEQVTAWLSRGRKGRAERTAASVVCVECSVSPQQSGGGWQRPRGSDPFPHLRGVREDLAGGVVSLWACGVRAVEARGVLGVGSSFVRDCDLSVLWFFLARCHAQTCRVLILIVF